MEQRSGKAKQFFRKLRDKYRLVIVNEKTFEERFSMRLSRLNIFSVTTLLFLLVVSLTVLLITFTPVKEYIPGFGNSDYRIQSEMNELRVDSIASELRQFKRYKDTLRSILNGTIGEHTPTNSPDHIHSDAIDLSNSAADSAFRTAVEYQDQYALAFNHDHKTKKHRLAGVFFYCPLRGKVIQSFNAQKDHFGVDVVAGKNKPISATLDGTVVWANWTPEDGYVIALQHSHEFISIYKHNSALLKKAGDRVKAGEAIAIIGNTGTTSTGPHLHFELWQNGQATDPEKWIVFK